MQSEFQNGIIGRFAYIECARICIICKICYGVCSQHFDPVSVIDMRIDNTLTFAYYIKFVTEYAVRVYDRTSC